MSRKDLYNALAKIAWADANVLEFPQYRPGDEKPVDPERLKRCHPALVAAAGEARREKELLERRSAEAPYLRELSRCLCAEKPSKALLEAQKEAMGDEEFLEYVLAHSQTEKALFAMAHARRLLTLAGREDEAKACDGDGFVSIFYPTAKSLVEYARKRSTITLTISFAPDEKGQDDGQAQ
jgi:hypothetical protein